MQHPEVQIKCAQDRVVSPAYVVKHTLNFFEIEIDVELM